MTKSPSEASSSRPEALLTWILPLMAAELAKMTVSDWLVRLTTGRFDAQSPRKAMAFNWVS